MLLADVVKCTDEAALYQAVIALGEIGLDDHGADKLLIVINGAVTWK